MTIRIERVAFRFAIKEPDLGGENVKSGFWVRLTNLLITLLVVLTVLMLVTLPFLTDKYAAVAGVQVQNMGLLKVFLYLTAIPFAVLLLMAKRLCKNILRKVPFCKSSIMALNVISICAFIDFLLYAVGTIVILKNLLSLTLMVAAFMIGLASLVLSQLAGIAMEMKQENDLTI